MEWLEQRERQRSRGNEGGGEAPLTRARGVSALQASGQGMNSNQGGEVLTRRFRMGKKSGLTFYSVGRIFIESLLMRRSVAASSLENPLTLPNAAPGASASVSSVHLEWRRSYATSRQSRPVMHLRAPA